MVKQLPVRVVGTHTADGGSILQTLLHLMTVVVVELVVVERAVEHEELVNMVVTELLNGSELPVAPLVRIQLLVSMD
jgi:hypothetical protein